MYVYVCMYAIHVYLCNYKYTLHFLPCVNGE